MPTFDRQYHQNAGGGDVSEANDVLLAIGRLQASVDHLRQDFSEEKRSAAESRKSLYAKNDEVADEISKLKTDIIISGRVTAQVREEVKQVGRKVDEHKADIATSIEDWKKIKTLGLGITGVLAIGGLSVGALLAMSVDAVKAAIRQWLGG